MKTFRLGAFCALMGAPIMADTFPALAHFSYPGCADLQAADFKATELFNRGGNLGAAGDATLSEPVQFALHGVNKNGALDHVDIYFVERKGAVKYWDGAAKQIKVMGHITVHGAGDSGLMGVGLDPGFDTNAWIYLWYLPPAVGNAPRHMILGRFVVNADHTLNMASEKRLLDIKGSNSDHWHTGGPMSFDAYGDLWINIGNQSPDCLPDGSTQYSTDSNVTSLWGPPNTLSMRGGMIRIHPDNSAKGYSVPSGNFGDYWAAQWEKQGRADLAAQYRDPAKVLPEVYVKGERSNYSLWVHPTKRLAAWGTVNYKSDWDEFNFTDHPIFTGQPFFMGSNVAVPGQMQALKMDESAAAPVLNWPWPNSPAPVKELPPATPGAVSSLPVGGSPLDVAITGPMYVFDRSLASSVKFPPHFDNVWFGFGFKKSVMMAFAMDTNTWKVTSATEVDNGVLAALKLRSPLGGHFGPDGSLYVLNYDGFYSAINPGITRVDYVGPCKPAVAAHPPLKLEPQFSIALTPARLVVREAGPHRFRLFDLAGNRLFTLAGESGAEYDFGKLRAEYHLHAGVHVVEVKTGKGLFIRNVSLL